MEKSPPPQRREATNAAKERKSGPEVPIAITLSGKDSSGREFREYTRTLLVTGKTATLATTHNLAQGTEIKLENRKLGRRASARVTWTGERSSPKDPLQIGVEIYGGESIWEIEYPAENSREAAPQMPEAPMERMEEPAVGPLSRAAVQSDALPEGLEAAAQNFERRFGGLVNQLRAEAEAQMRASAGEVERRLADIFEQRLQEIMAKLDAAHRDLDVVLQNQRTVQESCRRQMEDMRAEIQASAGRAVDAGIEEVTARISKELEAQQSGLAEHLAGRVAESAFEDASKSAEERLAGLLPGLESKFSDQLWSRINQEKEQAIAQARGELTKHLENVTGDLVAGSARTLAEGSQTTLANAERGLQELSAASHEKLKAQSAALLEENLRQADERFQMQATTRLEEIHQSMREKLGQTAEETFSEKRTAAEKLFVDEMRKQLAALTKSTAAAMNKQAQAGLDRYQDELRKKVETELAAAGEQLKKAVQDAIAQATDLLRASLAGALSSFSPGAKNKPGSTEEA